ncbi:MAG: glucose-1-phosphate thymidylyltransferase [Candidatus Bathyarchaeota archaeon]|nr:glucose-1-phosphate thymidylyltransferase [Candidatus Bathyarchaeota archaeon]
MKGVLLHGGHGTRLRPLTHTGPKQLIPVANRPISQHALEDLVEAGISEIAIVLGNTYPEKVKEHYGEGSKFGAKITYINQDEPKGIAHAIGLCEGRVRSSPFIVYLGDNLIKGGIKDFVETFETSDHDAMILLAEVQNAQRFGVAKLDKKGKLVALIEKPKEPPSNLALTGIYFFKPVIFDMIRKLKPSWRGELEITEAIQLLLEKDYKVGYEIVKRWWKDTGTPEDILEANRLVLDELRPEIKGEIEDKSSVQGKVSIGKNTPIKKGTLIRGPTIIGENSTIENDVYVGPYTSIGNNVTIRRGEIENSIVMDNCLINANERITDSLIAPYSKIVSNNNKPRARRFILGERSHVEL